MFRDGTRGMKLLAFWISLPGSSSWALLAWPLLARSAAAPMLTWTSSCGDLRWKTQRSAHTRKRSALSQSQSSELKCSSPQLRQRLQRVPRPKEGDSSRVKRQHPAARSSFGA